MESGSKTTQIFLTFKERFRTDQSSQSTLASKTTFALPEQHKTSQALLAFSFKCLISLAYSVIKTNILWGAEYFWFLLFTCPWFITENTSITGQQ